MVTAADGGSCEGTRQNGRVSLAEKVPVDFKDFIAKFLPTSCCDLPTNNISATVGKTGECVTFAIVEQH